MKIYVMIFQFLISIILKIAQKTLDLKQMKSTETMHLKSEGFLIYAPRQLKISPMHS